MICMTKNKNVQITNFTDYQQNAKKLFCYVKGIVKKWTLVRWFSYHFVHDKAYTSHCCISWKKAINIAAKQELTRPLETLLASKGMTFNANNLTVKREKDGLCGVWIWQIITSSILQIDTPNTIGAKYHQSPILVLEKQGTPQPLLLNVSISSCLLTMLDERLRVHPVSHQQRLRQ